MHVHAVISGMGRPQENRIFRFLNIHKTIAFYSKKEVHCMKYGIRWENKNFDDMGTLTWLSITQCLNFRKFKAALNPMYRIVLNFAKSYILSCLSKLYHRKKFHRAIFEI